MSFIQEARTWQIDPDEIQVSYDVVNLYPSVPVKEATVIILEQLSNDEELTERTKLQLTEIKTLIDLCLEKCYYLWNYQLYELQDSGPIGLALMVVMSEGFLQFHENRAIQQSLTTSVNLKSFKRYVDDSQARFPSERNATEFLHILNSQHPKIQYNDGNRNMKIKH